MPSNLKISGRSVPFSCCKLRSNESCNHQQLAIANLKTLNVHGCAEILNSVLWNIVTIAYVLTSIIIVLQILLTFLLIVVSARHFPCTYYHLKKDIGFTLLANPRNLFIRIRHFQLGRKPVPEQCPVTCCCLISRFGNVGPLHETSDEYE